MKPRGRTTALTAVGLLALLPWVIGWARYSYGFLEAHAAFWLIADGGTVYSTEFTEERFQSIEAGMPREAVHELLGDPLVLPWWQGPIGKPSEWWVALPRRAGNNAHLRCIEFGSDHRVSRVVSRPYID